jgi:hypothetical protein
VQVGMTPADVARLAHEAASAHGFHGWFHAPEVQRTSGRAAGWRGRLSRAHEAPLREGDLLAIDLGPATDDAYADIGCTLVGGGSAEPRVLEVARACVRACIGYASRWKTVGEVQVVASAWAVNHRMELAAEGVGHRVLPREGWLANGWPRSAHLATRLRRNQIHRLHPVRMAGMFAVRPVVVDPRTGQSASFEEVVWIDGERKHLLGRASIDAACGGAG